MTSWMLNLHCANPTLATVSMPWQVFETVSSGRGEQQKRQQNTPLLVPKHPKSAVLAQGLEHIPSCIQSYVHRSSRRLSDPVVGHTESKAKELDTLSEQLDPLDRSEDMYDELVEDKEELEASVETLQHLNTELRWALDERESQSLRLERELKRVRRGEEAKRQRDEEAKRSREVEKKRRREIECIAIPC